MIQGTYYKEWSSVLGRDMEFKVYGSAGVPVLALPARGGRFYDWENNGMPDAIAQLLNDGKVQLFCADSIDGEAILNGDAALRRRAEMEEKYFVYLTAELAPRVLALNGAKKDDARLWCVGIDLGAVHADQNGIANKLALAKAEENSLMLCAGQGAYEGDALDDTQALADLLKDQGLPAHVEIWGGDVSHDWYWWGKMLSLFVPRILEK